MCFSAEAPVSLSRFGFGAGEGGERLAEFSGDANFAFGFGVVVDQHPLEEGLVDELLDVFGRARVGVADAFGEVERQLQVLPDAIKVRGARQRFAAYGRSAPSRL